MTLSILKFRTVLTAIFAALMLPVLLFGSGCTTTKEIIVDRQGIDYSRYAADKAECETYASEVRTGDKVLKGAASGAAIGAVVGAIADDSTEGTVRAAGVGAVAGGVQGLAEGEREQVSVVKQCLRGRGYKVLN